MTEPQGPKPNGAAVALDFGGTKLAAGLVALSTGEVVRRVREATPRHGGRDASLAVMLEMVRKYILPESGAFGPIQGIGISFGGHVDWESGRVARSMHVGAWDDFPLGDHLSKELGLPAFVENDANAVALGLKRFGPAKHLDDFLYVTISTGVGAAVVAGGEIVHGKHNLAGELGHMVLRADGPMCTCGKRGCVEALAAGPAIARLARERVLVDRAKGVPQAVLDPLAAEVDQKGGGLRAEDVFRLARLGSASASEVIEDAASHLGWAIALAVNLLDPDAVFLGGGVASGGEPWFSTLDESLRAGLLPEVASDLQVIRVQNGEEAALKGAAALVVLRG